MREVAKSFQALVEWQKANGFVCGLLTPTSNSSCRSENCPTTSSPNCD